MDDCRLNDIEQVQVVASFYISFLSHTHHLCRS